MRATMASAEPAPTASGLMMASVVCMASSSGKRSCTAEAAASGVAEQTTGASEAEAAPSGPSRALIVDAIAAPAGPTSEASARTQCGRETQMTVLTPEVAYSTSASGTPGRSCFATEAETGITLLATILKPAARSASVMAAALPAAVAPGSTSATACCSGAETKACAPNAIASCAAASSELMDTATAFLSASVPKRLRNDAGATSLATSGSAGPTIKARSPMAKGFSSASKQLGAEVRNASSTAVAAGISACAFVALSVSVSSATTTKPLASMTAITSARAPASSTSGLSSANVVSFGKTSGKKNLSSRCTSAGGEMW
mmetsp:Transcript_32564/g.76124  ORF Transcript_32564/g.76124 Transcript_32564/m.76124 type:complete len:318 (-) Transcript_32564:316-1269(-)